MYHRNAFTYMYLLKNQFCVFTSPLSVFSFFSHSWANSPALPRENHFVHPLLRITVHFTHREEWSKPSLFLRVQSISDITLFLKPFSFLSPVFLGCLRQKVGGYGLKDPWLTIYNGKWGRFSSSNLSLARFIDRAFLLGQEGALCWRWSCGSLLDWLLVRSWLSPWVAWDFKLLWIYATPFELRPTTSSSSLLALTNWNVSLTLSFCEGDACLKDTLAACEYATQTIWLACPTRPSRRCLRSLPSAGWAVFNGRALLVLDISNLLIAATSWSVATFLHEEYPACFRLLLRIFWRLVDRCEIIALESTPEDATVSLPRLSELPLHYWTKCAMMVALLLWSNSSYDDFLVSNPDSSFASHVPSCNSQEIYDVPDRSPRSTPKRQHLLGRELFGVVMIILYLLGVGGYLGCFWVRVGRIAFWIGRGRCRCWDGGLASCSAILNSY